MYLVNIHMDLFIQQFLSVNSFDQVLKFLKKAGDFNPGIYFIIIIDDWRLERVLIRHTISTQRITGIDPMERINKSILSIKCYSVDKMLYLSS